MKIYRLILVIFFFASVVIPQQLNFQKIGPEKGLDISQIFTLVQLDNNLIVAGTFGGGIYFFNGTEFINLRIEDGLANNKIAHLAVGPNGELWIATLSGISKYSETKFTNYYTSHGLSNNIVNRMLVTREGIVYAGTKHGLDVYKPSTEGAVFQNIFSGKIINSLFEDADGNLWVGTGSGLYIFTEGGVDSTRYKELIGESITVVKEGPDNKMFVGTNSGLYLLSENKVKKIDKKAGLASEEIFSLLTTSDGDCWIGTIEGLSRITDGQIRNYGKKEGIHNYAIYTILEDHENNIWFGTDEGMFKLISTEFEIFHDPDGNKIDAWCIKRDKWGTLWAGAHQQGAYRMIDGKFQRINGNSFFKDNAVGYIYQGYSDYLWFCSDKGAARYDGSVFETILPPSLTVRSMFESTNGTTLFGTWSGGIYSIIDDKFTLEEVIEPRINHFELFKDELYIGTSEGLFIMDEDGIHIPEWAEPFATLDVIAIKAYSEKQLILGVFELGVILANFENNESVTLDTISVNDGLNDNSVLAMEIDGSSDLWVGTNKGLNRIGLSSFEPGNKITVNGFGYDDGIPGSELLEKSMYYDNTGYMWFGTISGLARFKPAEINENNYPVELQFTSFAYTDGMQEINFHPDYLSNRLIDEEEIEIPVTDSDITVSFAATHFRSPAGLKYRYKINDGPWSRLSTQRTISLPNLSHGSYSLTVEAEGGWNTSTEAASLRFVIPTPFWETIWFQIILAAGFVMILFWAYRLKTAKSREKQKELEERLEERERYEEQLEKQYKEIKIQQGRAEKSDKVKSEFLAQMSHEVRTPLNIILNYTSLLKEKYKDEEELTESFSIMDNNGKRLIRTIESILNMSQIQAGTLETRLNKIDLSVLVKSITEDFKLLADSKNLELKFSLNTDYTTTFLDEYTISHLVQNLIDNAITYTDQGYVHISLNQNSSGKLTLEIEDTGIGIAENYLPDLFAPFSQEDAGYTRKFDGIGLGLSLVKKYCEINSAEIIVESEKGVGSKFTVVFNT